MLRCRNIRDAFSANSVSCVTLQLDCDWQRSGSVRDYPKAGFNALIELVARPHSPLHFASELAQHYVCRTVDEGDDLT